LYEYELFGNSMPMKICGKVQFEIVEQKVSFNWKVADLFSAFLFAGTYLIIKT